VDYEQEYIDRGTDRLGVQVYPEPAEPAAPFVLIWPAMGVPARYYRRFAVELGRAGLGVAVVDLRGTGASEPPAGPGSRYGYADLAADVDAVLAELKPRLDGRRVLLLGHSLGGQLCVLHLALADESIVDGLILVAVGLPYWRTYPGRRRLWVLSLTQSIAATTRVLRHWPGWGFGGRQARGVIRDWAYTARHGRFRAGIGADLARVRVPVLAIGIEGDAFTPSSTVDYTVAAMSGASVVHEPYTAAQAGAPLDHFSWVRASAALADRIAAFAASISSPS
jgi:predicted alpha/beta hydrolase